MKIKRLLPVLIYLLVCNFAFALGQSDPNLIAWYKFDEGSGNIAYDATDNGNDAAISKTDKWDSGGIKSSNCLANLSLYSTLYVEVPSSTFTNIDKQITLSLWIWTDPERLQGRICKGYDSTRSRILSLSIYNSSSADKQYITAVMGADSAGNNDIRWWWGYQDYYYPHQGSWHHLAITKDCENDVERIYYDGKMQASFTPVPAKTMAGIETLKLFTNNGGNWSDYFRGKLDDIKIYDRALTSQEIQRIAMPDEFAADFNFDMETDLKDLEIIAEDWLNSGSLVTADADGDEDVDMVDYSWLAKNYAPGDWDKHGWDLTFHDEFDGNDIDTVKWNIGRWSGYEGILFFPSDDPDIYTVSNGTLKLHNVIKDYYDSGTQTTKHYGSGMIDTNNKFDQAFGYFECSAKLPVGNGSFPAFWLMPILPGGTWWPNAEIDIMEHTYNIPLAEVGANIHWNNYGDDHVSWSALFAGKDTKYTFSPPDTAFDDFHVYAMKWEPGVMYFYVDGYNYCTYRDEDAPDTMYSSQPASYDPNNIKVPTNPGYIILNNSLASWMDINTEGATSTFEIDYIRVYKKIE